jgi:hypothetical protein
MNNKSIVFILAILVLVFSLSACGVQPTAALTLTPAPAPPVSTATPSLPTATPTPASSATLAVLRVLLIAPKEMDARQVTPIKKTLEELAAGSGFTFETRASIQPAELDPSFKIVVFLNTPANLTELASAGSKTQFVVAGVNELRSFPNLNLIRLHPERAAFLAGYLATIIAPDWRSAGLLASDQAAATILQESFLNVGRYYCGRCSPYYAPVVTFPLVTTLPANSTLAARKTAVDEMQKKIVRAMYVDPVLASNDLLAYLVKLNYILIGGATPADDFKARWAVTVSEDTLTPLRKLWPDLAAGKGGKVVDASLELTDIQPDFLSAGRQRLVQQVVEGLNSGEISPLSPAP